MKDKEKYSKLVYEGEHKNAKRFFSRYVVLTSGPDGHLKALSLTEYSDMYRDKTVPPHDTTEAVYCPVCKKWHFVCEYDSGVPLTETEKDEIAQKINSSQIGHIIPTPHIWNKPTRCPSCGYTADKGHNIISAQEKEKGPHYIPAYFDVRDNGTRLSFLWRYMYYVCDRKLDTAPHRKRALFSLTFNRETRRIYSMTPNGPRQIVSVEQLNALAPATAIVYPRSDGKANIQYQEYAKVVVSQIAQRISWVLVRKAKKIANEYMKKEHKRQANFSPLHLQAIINLFRFPGLQDNMPFQLFLMSYYEHHYSRYYGTTDRVLAQIKHVMHPEDILGIATNGCKKPGKADRKILYENPYKAVLYVVGRKLGITDYNVIRSMYQQLEYMLLQTEYNGEKQAFGFLKVLYKTKGLNALKAAIAYDMRPHTSAILWDTARMWAEITDAGHEADLSGNLQEIHDRYSKLAYLVRHGNQELHYGKGEEKFTETVDDYDFTLAKDTYELVDVGDEMGICVGISYREPAVRHDCDIVIMREKTEKRKAVGCLELRKQNGKWRLIQAKAKYNNLLQGEHAYALKKYVKQTSLVADCYDFEHIRKGNILDISQEIQKRFNYAHNRYEPAEQEVRDEMAAVNVQRENAPANDNNDGPLLFWEDRAEEAMPFQ